MSETTDAAMQSWENDVQTTQSLRDTQLYNQQQRLNALLAEMGQVPASVAFNLLIPAAMLMVSNQNTTDMEIEASQGNEEADVLTLINITQSDDNYLASNSGAYENASNAIIANPTDGPNYLTDPPVYGTNPDGTTYIKTNQEVVDDYNTTYQEAQDAQTDLQTIFDYGNPNDSSYNDPIYGGWCNENYASSMLAAYASWQSATDDLSAQNVSEDDPAGQSEEYYYALHMQDYAQNPASSPYATDVSNLTTSINTQQSSNNSMQSQIQGIIKTLMTFAQQYEGSTKSAGKSIIEEKNYWVQKMGQAS